MTLAQLPLQSLLVNHNELGVYSCPCDTQEVHETQQVHERVPTTPTAYMHNDQLTEPPMETAHVQHVQGRLLLLSLQVLLRTVRSRKHDNARPAADTT